MTELRITVPEKFEEQLSIAAKQMGVKKSKLVMDAVNRYVFIRELRKSAARNKKKISKLGYKSEAGIFNAVS